MVAGANNGEEATKNDGIAPTTKKKESGKRRVTMERKFAARTVAGLIAALAEDSSDLRVEVLSSTQSPMWRKAIDEVHISFSRLNFAPLKMRGPPIVMEDERKPTSLQRLSTSLKGWEKNLELLQKKDLAKNLEMELDNESSETHDSTKITTIPSSNSHTPTTPPTADDMFDQMDVDNSGSLDQEELFDALNLAMGEHDDTSALLNMVEDKEETQNKNNAPISTPTPSRRPRRPLWSRSRTDAMLERLAARLVKLYDTNGDGVVDRNEYRLMVADMAALRRP
jgi:Ca2+-binding EF-hand superfamily protein